MPLDQVCLINENLGRPDEGYGIPAKNPESESNTSHQSHTLNRTYHLEIRHPLPNHCFNGRDLDLVDSAV
jgi:hypothetical protein